MARDAILQAAREEEARFRIVAATVVLPGRTKIAPKREREFIEAGLTRSSMAFKCARREIKSFQGSEHLRPRSGLAPAGFVQAEGDKDLHLVEDPSHRRAWTTRRRSVRSPHAWREAQRDRGCERALRDPAHPSECFQGHEHVPPNRFRTAAARCPIEMQRPCQRGTHQDAGDGPLCVLGELPRLNRDIMSQLCELNRSDAGSPSNGFCPVPIEGGMTSCVALGPSIQSSLCNSTRLRQYRGSRFQKAASK